jgi:hypothetical protein
VKTGPGGGAPGGLGGAPPGIRGAPGGLGAEPVGGRGAELRDVSGSERYGDLLSAPVSIPPAFRNFGIPPANMPANCGGALFPPGAPPSPPSLLLRARFCGGGGARLDGAVGLLAIPGTGGAPIVGATGVGLLSIMGAERSLITPTFFRRAPPSMLLSRAPCRPCYFEYSKDIILKST